MAETAEQAPITSKPSLFRRIIERFRPLPQQEVNTPTQNFLTPEKESQPQIQTQKVPTASTVSDELRLPKKERKRLKQVKYEEWKATQKQVESPSKIKTKGSEVVSYPTAPAQEVKPSNLPPGIKESIPSDHLFTFTIKDIPWLEQKEVKVPLELVTEEGTDGQKFFYADFIHGKDLLEAEYQLVKQQGKSADNLFFSHIGEFLRRGGRHPYIKLIHDPKTDKPIYCAYNDSGPRVYFMRFDRIEGIPIIIHIATCDKERQIQVLTTISNWSGKQVKRLGKI